MVLSTWRRIDCGSAAVLGPENNGDPGYRTWTPDVPASATVDPWEAITTANPITIPASYASLSLPQALFQSARKVNTGGPGTPLVGIRILSTEGGETLNCSCTPSHCSFAHHDLSDTRCRLVHSSTPQATTSLGSALWTPPTSSWWSSTLPRSMMALW